MRVALQRHNVLLAAAVERHGGCVFKTVGDAFCVTFDHAPDALGAALPDADQPRRRDLVHAHTAAGARGAAYRAGVPERRRLFRHHGQSLRPAAGGDARRADTAHFDDRSAGARGAARRHQSPRYRHGSPARPGASGACVSTGTRRAVAESVRDGGFGRWRQAHGAAAGAFQADRSVRCADLAGGRRAGAQGDAGPRERRQGGGGRDRPRSGHLGQDPARRQLGVLRLLAPRGHHRRRGQRARLHQRTGHDHRRRRLRRVPHRAAQSEAISGSTRSPPRQRPASSRPGWTARPTRHSRPASCTTSANSSSPSRPNSAISVYSISSARR